MPESEKKMLTIYYIEDDESISYTIKEYLEEAGYKVCLFGDRPFFIDGCCHR